MKQDQEKEEQEEQEPKKEEYLKVGQKRVEHGELEE